MTVSTRATRSMAIGNETALSGSETMTSEIGGIINSIIPAATDDHPVVLPDFAKENLVGMLLISERDALVRIHGLNPYAIATWATAGDEVTNVGGTFTVNDVLDEFLYVGDNLNIYGAHVDAGHTNLNGVCTVMSAVEAAGVTTVEVSKPLTVINGAAVEVFDDNLAAFPLAVAGTPTATKFIARDVGTIMLGAALNEFVAPATLNVVGDFSWLQAGDNLLIREATTPANNGIFEVVTAIYDDVADTAIVLDTAVIAGEAAAAGTTMQWVRTQLMVRLTAGIPFLWSLNGNGIINPVLEDITTLLVTNANATLTSDFQARIITVLV